MKKLKGLVTLIAALGIVTSVLSGCTTKKVEKTETVKKEKPALKILINYGSFDPEADPGVKSIRDITGYPVKYEMLPQDKPLDKLNLLMSSGEEYDYIFLSASQKYILSDYIKKNLVTPLDDLIKKYPNIQKVTPLAFESVKTEGKIYALPSTGLPIPKAINFIRKDWLDGVGMKEPTNIDELYAVLKAFKDKDPGKLGAANTPFSTATPFMSAVSEAFGFIYGTEVLNGSVVDYRVRTEYKEYLTFLNKLYKEGLLDADFPINKTENVKTKIVAGKVGFVSEWVDNPVAFHTAMNQKNDKNSRYVPLAPLKDKNGKQRVMNEAGSASFGFIPKSSKNTEAVLDFVNTFLDKDNWKKITIGEEGVDYTVKEGKNFPILPRFNEQKNNMWAYLPMQDGDAYYPLWQTRVRKQVEYYELFDQVVEKNDKFKELNSLSFAPPLPEAAKNGKIVEDYIREESIKFIAGARRLTEFDKFVEEVNKKGMSAIVKELDDWNKTVKVK